MSKPRKKLIVKVGRFSSDGLGSSSLGEGTRREPRMFHLLHYNCDAAPQLSQLTRDALPFCFPNAARHHHLAPNAMLALTTPTSSDAGHGQPGAGSNGSTHSAPLTTSGKHGADGPQSPRLRSSDVCCAYLDQDSDLVLLRDSMDWLALLLTEAPRHKDAVIVKIQLLLRTEVQALGYVLPPPLPASPTTPTGITPPSHHKLTNGDSVSSAESLAPPVTSAPPPLNRSSSEPAPEPGATAKQAPNATRRRNSILSDTTTSDGTGFAVSTSDADSASPRTRMRAVREPASPPPAVPPMPSNLASTLASPPKASSGDQHAQGMFSSPPVRTLRKGASTNGLRALALLDQNGHLQSQLGQGTGSDHSHAPHHRLAARNAHDHPSIVSAPSTKTTFGSAYDDDVRNRGHRPDFGDGVGLALTTGPTPPSTHDLAQGEPIESLVTVHEHADETDHQEELLAGSGWSGPIGSGTTLRRTPSAASSIHINTSGIPSAMSEEEDESILFWGMSDAEAQHSWSGQGAGAGVRLAAGTANAPQTSAGGAPLKIRTWEYRWPLGQAGSGDAADDAGGNHHRIRAAFLPSRRLAQSNKVLLARAALITSLPVSGNYVSVQQGRSPEYADMNDLLELPFRAFSSDDQAYILQQWARPNAAPNSRDGMNANVPGSPALVSTASFPSGSAAAFQHGHGSGSGSGSGNGHGHGHGTHKTNGAATSNSPARSAAVVETHRPRADSALQDSHYQAGKVSSSSGGTAGHGAGGGKAGNGAGVHLHSPHASGGNTVPNTQQQAAAASAGANDPGFQLRMRELREIEEGRRRHALAKGAGHAGRNHGGVSGSGRGGE